MRHFQYEVLIGQVYEPARWIDSLDKSDPCWELFTYNSILNESRYLSRALKCLSTIAGRGKRKRCRNANFKELYSSLETVKGDVDKASEFLRGTIEMVSSVNLSILILTQVYNYLSIKEAGCAARTNNNMEYLAILASIFLPLTLFIVHNNILSMTKLTLEGGVWDEYWCSGSGSTQLVDPTRCVTP
jgi:hypothetical protein